MATNFLHFGYLLLPIACLLMLIDNKFIFKVKNTNIFVVLCLFGISFFLFSYKLGFYSLFGMFLPMAYYLGSNIKGVNEKKIIQLIYLFSLGMIIHVLLNFGYEFLIDGTKMFSNKKHLDFWLMGEGSSTQTAVNYIFIISTLYYVFVYEDNKKIKYLMIILFVLSMIYELALARRTPIFLFILMTIISIIFDKFVIKNHNKKSNIFIIIIMISIALFFIFSIVYLKYFNNPWVSGESISLLNRLLSYNFSSGRIGILLDAIKVAPQHLWGGQEITTLFDINIHDLWMDTFDYAGVISYILLVIYSIYCLIKMINTLKNSKLTKSFILLILTLFICVTTQMFLEPIITGSPVFLLCSIIVFTSIECLNSN